MPRLSPCQECGQSDYPLTYLTTDKHLGDLYRCPLCRSLWRGDELTKLFAKENRMYSSTNPNVDKYKQMEKIILILLPAYVQRYGMPELAAAIVKEFADMEQARQTIVGVEDTAKATVEYLDHHYTGSHKPFWYEKLTT